MAFLGFLLVMKHLSDGVMDTRNSATAIGFAALFSLAVGLSGGTGTSAPGCWAPSPNGWDQPAGRGAAGRGAQRGPHRHGAGATGAARDRQVPALFASRAALLFLELIGAWSPSA